MNQLNTSEVLRVLRTERDKCAQHAHEQDSQGNPVDAQLWRDNIQGINRTIIAINKLAGYSL